jgi:hypothetical protein
MKWIVEEVRNAGRLGKRYQLTAMNCNMLQHTKKEKRRSRTGTTEGTFEGESRG